VDDSCKQCNRSPSLWRCKECFGGQSFCLDCFGDRHRYLPFHRVEWWNGTYYEVACLWQAGVKLHLGHSGEPCDFDLGVNCRGPSDHRGSPANVPENERGSAALNIDNSRGHAADLSNNQTDAGEDNVDQEDDPELSPGQEIQDGEDDWEEEVADLDKQEKNWNKSKVWPRSPQTDNNGNRFIVVVHSNGIHHLPVVSCRCHLHDKALDLQYLELGLFPASFKVVKTVFTLNVLKDFRLTNLECKTSAYQYYQKLRRATCPAFPRVVANRYRELRRISRQYRNLKVYQVHGFLDESKTPGRGDLSLFCAACPQPEINLPPEWLNDTNRLVYFAPLNYL
jgi:CxC2 like cysteine cluster associated with KDZ transposases